MPLPAYDPSHEAKAIINELVYGGYMKLVPDSDTAYGNAEGAAEIIERCLREAMQRASDQPKE